MFISSDSRTGRFTWLKAAWLRTAVFVVMIVLGVLLTSGTAVAQVTPMTFDGFTGLGFSPTPTAGQLDSNLWRVTGLSDGTGTFGGTHTSGDFARGTSEGGVSTGGVYAFTNVGASGNTILGVQPTADDFTPGTFTLRIQNTTGNVISDVYIAYQIWYRNDQGRSNSLNFQYSLDDSAYTSVGDFDFTTPAGADALGWQSVSRSQTFTGINLANNAFLYLRWIGDDVGGSGSRDEYGIDNIEVRIGGPTAVSLQSFKPANNQTTNLILLAIVLVGLLGGTAILRHRRHLK
jgi:hypothetical protein